MHALATHAERHLCFVLLEMSPVLMQLTGIVRLSENSEQRSSQCWIVPRL